MIRHRTVAEAPDRARRRWPLIVAFLTPALALYLVFLVYPVVQGARYSVYDWNGLGDGSVYNPMTEGFDSDDLLKRSASKVRDDYRRSIEYTLNMLVSYLQNYGNDNLVFVFLGDHQPAPIVTGENASRDVPITIVAKDPAVLDRIAGWNWNDGIRPHPDAPVWRMDAFRDKFLTAFSG